MIKCKTDMNKPKLVFTAKFELLLQATVDQSRTTRLQITAAFQKDYDVSRRLFVIFSSRVDACLSCDQ
jgi:hypothetical protein